MMSALISLTLTNSTVYLTSRAVGVILIKELNAVDTKLLSAQRLIQFQGGALRGARLKSCCNMFLGGVDGDNKGDGGGEGERVLLRGGGTNSSAIVASIRRPSTTPFQNPPRNTTFPFQRYTLMFQQHQDESSYDAWTRFKNLIQKVPHHGIDLWSLTQLFYDHVDDYTRMDLDFVADENLRELSGEEAWEAIENFAQRQKEWDNPPNIIFEQELANLKAQAKRLHGNEKVWVEMHKGIAWDKVENLNP
ncbi:hypothetical protein Tco_0459964 [Tanacetum coccineum]